jgi:hypothetical protein
MTPPTLHYCVSQYTDTPPECCGAKRLGYISDWALHEPPEPFAIQSREPLKNNHRYPINWGTLRRRVDYIISQLGPEPELLMEVEPANSSGNPHQTPDRLSSRRALGHIPTVRAAIGTVTDAPIVAEYVNALPGGWADRHNIEYAVGVRGRVTTMDRDAWHLMAGPDHHTFSAYGHPSHLWRWRLAVTAARARDVASFDRTEQPRRPINVVVSHIASGRQPNTPRELATQAEAAASVLDGDLGDSVIYWGGGERGRSFNDAVLPGLREMSEVLR